MLTSHQNVILLVAYHNTVNIITCHISPSEQIIAYLIMPYHLEIVLIFGYLEFSEKKQQQSNKF